jgi:hypothetical protein
MQEMEAEVEHFYADLRAAGVPTRYTHRQAGELQWQYDDWLIAQCGPGGWRDGATALLTGRGA